MIQKDIDFFKHYHNFNHVDNLGGGALFNPCSLLMFVPSDLNIYVYNVLFAHEFAHARLSSCVYGKIIFFLRYISLGLMQNCFESNKVDSFKSYWSFYEKLNSIVRTLIKGWVFTQEGYATFYERKRMNQFDNQDIQKIKSELNKFLELDTPYSKGLNLMDNLSTSYSEVLLRNITHELGNINYIEDISKLLANKIRISDFITPDQILIEITEKLINYKKRNFIIWTNDRNAVLNARESVNPIALSRYIIFEQIESESNRFYDFEKNNVFFDLIECLTKYIEQKEIVEYLEKIRIEYSNHLNILVEKGGIQQVLAFPSRRIDKGEFWDIEINNPHVSEAEKESINYITNLNRITNKYLPFDKELYRSKLKELKEKYQISPISTFILRIFPPTKIENYKSNIISKKYPSTSKFLRRMKKQVVKIKCTNEQAKELADLYKEHSDLISVDSNNDEESFGHWLEVLEATVTIVASTLGIVDILKGWINEKKSNKENEKNIIVIIDDKKLDGFNDIDKIETLLEQLPEREKK